MVSYIRDAEEWEIIKFCPHCKIPLMYFEIGFEHSWMYGYICPKCDFMHDPAGCYYPTYDDNDGKLLEIKMEYKNGDDP